MNDKIIHKFLNYLISTVWLVNGLFCKLLNLVPRHEQIVAQILGEKYAATLTKIIGIAEILMAIWILSYIQTRINAVLQILTVATMNVLEFILVPNLLLFGKANAILAFLFIVLICYNEFFLTKKFVRQL